MESTGYITADSLRELGLYEQVAAGEQYDATADQLRPHLRAERPSGESWHVNEDGDTTYFEAE